MKLFTKYSVIGGIPLAGTVCLALLASCMINENQLMPADNWEPSVRKGIKDLISVCNREEGKEYVVFDFDNTCSIFDISEQLLTYQIETMSFELGAEEFRSAIFKNMDSAPKKITDKLEIIASDYARLCDKYGPFSSKGLHEEIQNTVNNDNLWLEFAISLATVYDEMLELIDAHVAYIWLYQLYAGMTEEELYCLASRSHRHNSSISTTARTWTLGETEYSWVDGITVTNEIKNLWKELHDNGIDIWVCSASCLQPVMAAVDVFGLHDYCSGVVAYVYDTDDSGRLQPTFDYDTGCGSIPQNDGSWKKDKYPLGMTTYTDGKVNAIRQAIAPHYEGKGPVAGFGDSTGDFNFCTEFESMKMVVFFNRANRKVSDGGGLISELAVYQNDVLGYNLAEAMKNDDTYYLLQGRDENGLRSLRKSRSTIQFGSDSERLFCNEDNYAQYEYFKSEKLSTREIIERFCISTPSGESPFGVSYGFLEEYPGYHSYQ